MDKQRMNDRHNVPRPQAGAVANKAGTPVVGDGVFLDGFKERIRDLFKTADGLDRHCPPIQDLFRSLSNSDVEKARKKAVAVKAYEQIVKAAEHATFDFPKKEFKCESIMWQMSVARVGGKVVSKKS